MRGPTSLSSHESYEVLTKTWCLTSMISSTFLKVTTLPLFGLLSAGEIGGKRCLRTLTTRWPIGVVKPYDSSYQQLFSRRNKAMVYSDTPEILCLRPSSESWICEVYPQG
jgi:hypothetical protein